MLSKKMLYRIEVLFVSLFFIICSNTTVLADTASESLNTILKNTHSIQANFTQNLTDTKGNNLQQARGKMYLQSPGMFRWETTNPSSQLIVANGSRLWIYDKDLQQVTIRALTQEAGETPALLLSDAHPAIDKSFSVTMAQGTSSETQKFILVPKDKSSMYARIQMDFAGSAIKNINMQDHLGHNTIIQFSNVKTNEKLPQSLFKFTPPKNVDVIDETNNIKKQR